MWRTEGMMGFFKGNGVAVLKNAPFSALEFYFYELFKNNLLKGKPKNEQTFAEKLMCGGLTGVGATVLTYPFDIMKTYLIVHVESEGGGHRSIME